jgi:hypothetical protein
MRRDMLIFWAVYGALLLAFLVNPIVVGWDPAEYLGYGKWLLSDYGFKAEYRPPVWPLTLGVLWKIGFPMPFTMKALTFLVYAAIPLVTLARFKDSRRYLGLLAASNPIFASWSHLPLSHPLATLLFVLAYSSSGMAAGVFAALSGLSRFTFLLTVPFICLKDRKKWTGALAVIAVFLVWSWALYGSPVYPLVRASEVINNPEYLWYWAKEPWFYLKALAFSPLLALGFLSRSPFALSSILAMVYFTLLPHKEFRFFADVVPQLSAATVEGFRKLPLVIAAFNVLLVPFVYDAYQLPPEAWDVVPNGATVVGMTPEVNAYKDVYFREWFHPAEIPEADYCIFFDRAIPCVTEECRDKKQEFRDMCQPLYERADLGLIVGTTRRPSGAQE